MALPDLLRRRPPGPFRAEAWRSPVRGTWLTSVLGLVLYVGVPVLVLTGLASWIAYQPHLPGNEVTPETGWIRWLAFDWPTEPVWLYRANQGLHVLLGLALVPVLLVKLWSVVPRLFAWPPARSPAQALERATIALLVGSALLTFATGVINIQLWYPYPFSFYRVHFYASWIFVAAFLAHVVIKTPLLVRTLRGTSARAALRSPDPSGRARDEEASTRTADPSADPADVDHDTSSHDPGLEAVDPDPPTVDRRGALGIAAGSGLVVLALSAGQVSSSDAVRRTALLAPRGRTYGDGPNDFQVNKTAAAVGVGKAETGPSWRLEVRGAGRSVQLSREELLAMPQRTYDLPIACVEGWSTSQTWTGVRLRDLAALVGLADDPPPLFVDSIQAQGAFRSTTLSDGQARDERSLLALRVNGADLSLDHGYPARVIVPAQPGVHNTKWVRLLEFRTDLA